MSAATILFAGTPEFARASLSALVESNNKPAVVLTQPDRPSGRGKKLTASAVKTYAQAQQIDVWQPVTLKDADIVAKIASLNPDVIVVAAYGLILPQAVLDIPQFGCINVHASLLPRWRGAAPIQQAILNGDAESGICLMQMDAGLDTGPVFACADTPITSRDTAGDLHDRLARMGGELLAAKLGDILDGKLEAQPQDDSMATYARKIRRQDARIDWNNDAEDVHRQIRAYNPVPGAYFELGDETIKCWLAELVEEAEGHAGTVLQADKKGVVVACRSGALLLVELQRPGKKRVTGAEFAAQKNLVGKRLG